MTAKVQYVQRVLSDRISQPGRWHVVSSEDRLGTWTKCGKFMSAKLYNTNWTSGVEEAPHTLQYSDFPRNARTADEDDTNVCRRCEPPVNR